MRLFVCMAALFVVLLSGCASVTGSKNQPIAVMTVCQGDLVKAATCSLTNDKGSWSVQTPGSVVINKAYGDLSVSCKKDDSAGVAVFQSKSNGGVWGNIVLGGVVGYAVDASSGAGFDYPSTLTIVMNPPCSQSK